MKITTKDFFDTVEQSAVDVINENGSHTPVLLFMNEREEITYMDLPNLFGSEAQKDMLAHLIQFILHKEKAVAAAFVTEAWFHGNEKGDPRKEFEKYGSVSAIPGKKEGLMINCMTRGKNWMVIYEIIRGEGNEFVIGKKDWGEDVKAEGRFANLLK